MSACVKPLGHTGRCKGTDGSSWENNHPTTYGEQQALLLADRMRRERDAAQAAHAALTRSSAVLGALSVLVSLHLGCDEWGPEQHDAAEAAANTLAPLVGVS